MEFAVKDGNQINKIGYVEFTLFKNKVPKTVENMISLINSQSKVGYRGSKLHRIIPGFMIQGGDFANGDGSGGHSIYGKYFDDECLEGKHDDIGILSMANCGPNTNGSQFFITLDYAPWLDGKHVIFGKVKEGLKVLKKIERYGSIDGKPKKQVRIVNCGVV